MTSPQVDPFIVIGMNRYSDASIPSGSVGLSNILIPNFWQWLGFISYFSIIFPKHKPCPNSSINTSPESCVKAVTPVHKAKFICSAYYERNGDTVQSSEVNDVGLKLAPKQWVSARLFISVTDALKITLS